MNDNQLKTCFFPSIQAMTPFTERWLSKQAANGWKLFRKSFCFSHLFRQKKAESNTSCIPASVMSADYPMIIYGQRSDMQRRKPRLTKQRTIYLKLIQIRLTQISISIALTEIGITESIIFGLSFCFVSLQSLRLLVPVHFRPQSIFGLYCFRC